MLVFTAPSGAGKTTIVRHLLSSFESLDFSVSATNRAKRTKEVEGKDYYFLSTETFKEKIKKEAEKQQKLKEKKAKELEKEKDKAEKELRKAEKEQKKTEKALEKKEKLQENYSKA
ncbi:MAG: hypothetical protein AAGK97_11920, partial [Bacteroidota bacterium]